MARVRVIVRLRVGCPLSWPQGPRLKAGARHRAMQSGVESWSVASASAAEVGQGAWQTGEALELWCVSRAIAGYLGD